MSVPVDLTPGLSNSIPYPLTQLRVFSVVHKASTFRNLEIKGGFPAISDPCRLLFQSVYNSAMTVLWSGQFEAIHR